MYGGVIPATASEKKRAAHAKLGTTHPDVGCRNCANCVFYDKPDQPISWCSQKEIQMDVSWNQGCKYWQNKDIWIPSA